MSFYPKDPDAVGIVNVTDVTTTSISLIWTEPEGRWSFFNVLWTNGTITEIVSVTETPITITGLTAGVQYEVSVSAVAGDNLTEGQKTSVTLYTSKYVVGALHVLSEDT